MGERAGLLGKPGVHVVDTPHNEVIAIRIEQEPAVEVETRRRDGFLIRRGCVCPGNGSRSEREHAGQHEHKETLYQWMSQSNAVHIHLHVNSVT